MKRLMAVLIALALAATLGIGFASAEGDDLVQLRLFHRVTPSPDIPLVSEAISDYSAGIIGATVELVYIDYADYPGKISMLIASDEAMDMGFDANWLDYFGRSRAGAYLDITDMLDNVPLLRDTIGETMWNGSRVDGRIYGVPTKKEYATQWAVMVEEDFILANGIDISGIKTMEDAEIILEALAKDPDRCGYQCTMNGYGGTMLCNNENYFFNSSFDSSYVTAMRISEPGVIVNYYETEEFKDYCAVMRRWYELGYIDPNVATLENYDKYTKDAHNMGMSIIGYSPLTEINSSLGYGKTITPITVTPICLRDGGVVGSINCIYNKTQYPEKALAFMELWNTDSVVKNYIAYGILDKHYTLNEEGKAKYIPDSGYVQGNWTTGNMYISYLLDTDADNKYELYDQFNSDALISPMVGFQPNTDAIADKIAACNGVKMEYVPLLMCGAIDPDEFLPILIDALRAAGSGDIVDEMQRQFDAFAG